MVRKTHMSETETSDVMRGILMVIRELTPTVISASTRKETLSRSGDKREAEKRQTTAPLAITNHMYDLAKLRLNMRGAWTGRAKNLPLRFCESLS
jgi:hypothetical protein